MFRDVPCGAVCFAQRSVSRHADIEKLLFIQLRERTAFTPDLLLQLLQFKVALCAGYECMDD